MPNFRILYDEPQEADWFRSLHPDLSEAAEEPITGDHSDSINRVLAYDRPDIVLVDGEEPVLVVEETVEVPSGHNVGQRFARIAAAAEAGVPCLYFSPYVAKKHGGATAGPRYMNTRLFHALDTMVALTGTAVTTVNWPVDQQSEVRRDPGKDDDVREYADTFLSAYNRGGRAAINREILASQFHRRMIAERDLFVRTQIRRPEQYLEPPSSVEILSRQAFINRVGDGRRLSRNFNDVVLYKVGMNNIRSDPYTGMALLYRYLYVKGRRDRALVFWFPGISWASWVRAATNTTRKDIRLFRMVTDAIWFADWFRLKTEL